jgi:hypothetical protein
MSHRSRAMKAYPDTDGPSRPLDELFRIRWRLTPFAERAKSRNQGRPGSG